MSLWVKICGNTSLEDAQIAAAAGADAVGFVLAQSPRRVTAAQVAAITPHLPKTIEKIGVFVDAPFEEIVATVETAGLTGIQLHFQATPEFPARLKDRLGPNLHVLRVVHFEADSSAPNHLFEDGVDAVLVDSKTAVAVGGTGRTFDWSLASKTLFQNPEERKFIAAGGLTPENVAEAITTLKPWGVDTVSGVEAAPGRKNPVKVAAFIANARAASGR
jgi:phosphoribosylanthranilate isomerase